MVSHVCEAFNCTPDVAERQDWALVQAILDYRAARLAVDLMNDGSRGYEQLVKRPELQDILLRMHRAQQGDQVTYDDVVRAMATEDDDGERG